MQRRKQRWQLEILGRMGLSPCGGLEALKGAGFIVDAVFGIGLTREVAGEYARTVEAINASALLYAPWIYRPGSAQIRAGSGLCRKGGYYSHLWGK